MNLVERDRRHLWHPYTQELTAPLPIPIIGGKGVWLETEDGRQILDGISSWWVNIHGHSHPVLNEVLAKQAGRIEHTLFAGFTHRPAVELAEKLVAALPAGLTRVFYSDNGSTAVEVALKMTYQFWRNRGEERKTFVALTNAYHGDTFGAMSTSDQSGFTEPFKNLFFHVLRADSPYSLHCAKCAGPDVNAAAGGRSPGKCNLTCIESLKRILEEHHKDVAAVIIEPMLQGAGGMIVWESGFLAEVGRLCAEFNVLLIADEVLTGFGRTGKMFACEHAAISPDIICLSKALTAGYLPLGATVATEEIYGAFLSEDRSKTFFHGHSYTANPLACAVGAASLEIFEREGVFEKIGSIERKFRDFVPSVSRLRCVAEARTIGGVLAVELDTGESGYFADVGQKLYLEFLSRDILLRPLGSVLYFIPPYVITESETERVLGEILNVLSSLDDS